MMNILVFSDNAWDNTNSLGNTLSNFFEGDTWKKDNFSNVYLRNAKPNNKVCKKYYRMTIFDMVKHYFNKEKIGLEFNYECSEEKKDNKVATTGEQKCINFLHKHSIKFIYYGMDFIFRRKKWNNIRFQKFIRDNNPDIMFAFLANVAVLNPFIECIKQTTKAKIVIFIADDVYGQYNKRNIILRKKYLKEMKNIINNSDIIYAISNELCEEYSKIYKKDIKLLHKGCNFNYPIKRELNPVIKFIYAGNLLYGRDEILTKIAQAIEKCNKNGQSAILEVYTGSSITENLDKNLNIDGSSIIKGKRDYEEIKEIMNKAEYNLHVESFYPTNIESVKYSFSTKIIDCMQSGSSLVGIGPNTIASIKYIKNIPGAHVIDKIEDIDNKIKELIMKKDGIIKDAKKIRDFAMNNHEITANQNKLREDFIKLKNKKRR